VDLGITFTTGVPLRRQLEQALRAAIRAGRLTSGSMLPSSRDLAEELGVSRGVVVARASPCYRTLSGRLPGGSWPRPAGSGTT
jgi:DNA-binding transcriptional MocR family regulator